MKNFSIKHKLHLLHAGEYGLHLARTINFIEYNTELSLRVQIYWLRALAFFWVLFLKLLLWPLYLVVMPCDCGLVHNTLC